MTRKGAKLAPIDGLDHARGPDSAPLILMYGDYECPYTRRAYREIQQVEKRLPGGLRLAYRHFPLTDIHPHALAASAGAEAAHLQNRFWEMHDLLFHRQEELEDDDLRGYAAELELDVERFDADRGSDPVLKRIERDVRSGIATNQVQGTPTIFIDGIVHRSGYDGRTLLGTLAQ